MKQHNVKLEWGCPNGTKYPPRQPFPNHAILPNRVYRRTDGQGDSSIPPPPNFVAGGIINICIPVLYISKVKLGSQGVHGTSKSGQTDNGQSDSYVAHCFVSAT